MGLNGKQRKQLMDALISAFPSISRLKMMLSYELNLNLSSIADGDNLQDTVFQLIEWTESQGKLEDLIKAALESNLGNQELSIIAYELISEKIVDRQPLPLIEKQPELKRGNRLNIVQHPGGDPLIYAIRNNFYVGTGDNENFLRYLTDTEGGSSGSPVLNDYWKVIGLHHAATPIPP